MLPTLHPARPGLALLAALALGAPAAAQQYEAALLHPATPGQTQFGRDVAMTGKWAMVGDLAKGTVAFFRRGPTGWRQVGVDRGAQASLFGRGLDTDGQTLVVGAMRTGWPDDPRGSVRIYELMDGRWEAVQGIPAPAFLEEDNPLFGAGVAVDGDVMAIGAAGVDEPMNHSGMLLVYERTQGVWVLVETFMQGTVHGPTGQQWALGVSCDVVGQTIVASAPGINGAVYTFERDDEGWHRVGILHEPDPPDDGKGFGDSVSLSYDGATLVVGQANPDATSTPFVEHPGRVHVFDRTPIGGWTRVQVLRASDEHFVSGGTDFGLSVAIEEDAIVVGAHNARGDPDVPGNEGAAYLYRRRPDGTWPPTEDRRFWGTQAGFALGKAVDIEDGFVVAGSTNQPAHVFEVTVGEEFCMPATNSTGEPGKLSAVGSPAIAENTFTLSARDCPPERPGYFVASHHRGPRVLVGDGCLCLGPPFLRLGGLAPTGRTGAAQLELDLSNPRYGSLVAPGSRAYFQYWFADTVGAGSNLTGGVAVRFE